MASARTTRAPGSSLLSFSARFFGFLFLASLLFSLLGLHARLLPVQTGIARAAVLLARSFGVPVEQHGAYISTPSGTSLHVNHECTGVFVLVIWASFLFAYPAGSGPRALGFLLGLVVIEGTNIARLATLAAVGSKYPALFDYFHEYLWQGVFVALLAVLGSWWRDRVERAHAVSA
ncbi:MAG: hypothetical protein KatS3mg076_2450 [Candidatus Binatia bacterium]|nr:MAG: hypothetical protein KatS3mg076_2450 [Candidatus Binatia bacterium]